MRFLRYLKYAFLVIVAVGLAMIALANTDPVTLELVPAAFTGILGQPFSLELPLFMVVLASVVVGLLVGFVWEWLREHRHRAEAATQKRAARQLEQEVKTLKGRENEGKDEILALVEDTGAAR